MARKRQPHRSQQPAFMIDIDAIKSALAEVTQDAKEAADDIIAKSTKDFKMDTAKIQKQASAYVAKDPLKTLGVALTIGIAIGYLIHK